MRALVWMVCLVSAGVGCAGARTVDPAHADPAPGHIDTWGWVANVSPGSMDAYVVELATDDRHHYMILINPQLWRSVILRDRAPTALIGQRVHLAAAITDETAVHELGWNETLHVLDGAADQAPVSGVDSRFIPAGAGTVRRWQGRIYEVRTFDGIYPVQIEIAPPGLGPRVVIYLESPVVRALAAEGHAATELGHEPIEVRGLMQVENPTAPFPNYIVVVSHREQLVLSPDAGT